MRDEIAELAQEIYAEATILDKEPRHNISNLANLINWITCEIAEPGDSHTLRAIEELRKVTGATQWQRRKN